MPRRTRAIGDCFPAEPRYTDANNLPEMSGCFCTLACMLSDSALLPRSRGDIDDDLSRARQDLRHILRKRRLTFAAYAAAILIEASLIVMGIYTSRQGGGWTSSAGIGGCLLFFGSFALVFGLMEGDGNHFDLSRATLVKRQKVVEQLVIERRESLIGSLRGKEAVYTRYREAMPDLVAHYRKQANRYRLANSALQAFVIVAALSVSAIAGLFGTTFDLRALIVVIALAIAIASSMGILFRLRERGSQLQQTADQIEIEFRAVELGINAYADALDKTDALRIFVEKVEELRGEHMMRQRQLDQPSDLRYVDVSSISIDRLGNSG